MRLSRVGLVVLGVALIPSCGRTKPLGRDVIRALPFRCQCTGETCFLIKPEQVDTLRICKPDGTFRTARRDELDTIVCSDARCAGERGFCKPSAEVPCLKPNPSGSGPDPTSFADFNAQCDATCGTLGQRRFVDLVDGGSFLVISECRGGAAVESQTVCGPAFVGDPPPIQGFSPAFTSEASVLDSESHGEIQLLGSDGHPQAGTPPSPITVSGGGIHLVPERCSSGLCPATVWVGVGLNTFVTDGKTVTNGGVTSEGPLLGFLDPDGVLTIPSARFAVSGVVDREGISADFSSATPITATVDPRLGRITMELALADETRSLNVTLVSRITRSPPTPIIEGPTAVECTSAQGASVTFTSSLSSDRQGPSDLRDRFWYLSSTGLDAPRELGPTLVTNLPFGSTTVTLRVLDSTEKEGTAEKRVDVSDSAPPVFGVGEALPPCLWPPSHEMVLYELGADLVVNATDVCSSQAALKVSIVEVSSSEAADAKGSGNTAPDVVYGTGALCVRAERSGSGSGRTYTVRLKAVDHRGNAAETTLNLAVPHDSRLSSRCRDPIAQSRFVNADDPRCTANATEPAAPVPAAAQGRARASGCSSASAEDPLVFGVAVFALLGWRRREGIRAAGKALVLAGLSACEGSTAQEQCIAGWWLSQPTSCALPCGQSTPPGECSASDCEVRAFLLFGADHSKLSGTIVRAPSSNRYSAWGARVLSTWALEGSNVVSADTSMAATCSASKLTLDGQLLLRADAALSSSLNASVENDAWAAVQY